MMRKAMMKSQITVFGKLLKMLIFIGVMVAVASQGPKPTVAPISSAPSDAPSLIPSFQPALKASHEPSNLLAVSPTPSSPTPSSMSVAMPSLAPSTSAVPVQGNLYLLLTNVTGLMNDSITMEFEASMVDFLTQTLQDGQAMPLEDIAVGLTSQRIVDGLDQGIATLEVILNVTGLFPQQVDISSALQLTVQDNQALLIQILQSSGTVEGMNFFLPLVTIQALAEPLRTYSPTVAPSSSPTMTRTSSRPSGLPTESPSMSGTFLVQGKMFLVLNTASIMNSEIQQEFLGDIVYFLGLTLQEGQAVPLMDISASLEYQRLSMNTISTGRRRLVGAPLEVGVLVKGKSTAHTDLSSSLKNAVDTNEVLLVGVLQKSNTTAGKAYFSTVTKVAALDMASPTQSPTTAPGDGSSLSTGAIVGIAVGGGVFLIFILVGVWCCLSRAISSDGSLAPSSAPPNRKSNKPPDSQNSQPSQNTGSRQASRTSGFVDEEIGVDVDELGNVSMIGTDYGGDNLSYAYSLDAGHVENSVISSQLPNDVAQAFASPKSDLSQKRPDAVTRKVYAPPGKLGIVIDTTLEGPVVHKVNPKSPLEGEIFPGDIIVAIDNVDTRAMSASAITALMVKTANQKRVLTVLSEDTTQS